MFPERSVATVLLAVASLFGLTSTGGGYVDGPPPGHTGGFGEPTCAVCHTGPPENPSEGSLTLKAPESFEPGVEYALELRLRHPRLLRGGFQLSARFAEGAEAGRQAGTIAAGGPDIRVADSRDVQYAAHTRNGVEPVAAHESCWRLRWTAPDEGLAPVVFHVAANAANYDDSELGDVVLLESVRALPRPIRSPAPQ